MIILSGVIVGFIFDLYRIVRWQLGLNRILTFIGDLFFSIFAIVVIFYFGQKANFLELRFYLFLGALLGLIIYLKFFSFISKKVFKTIITLIATLKNVIVGIIVMVFQGFARFLTILMSIPYGVLKWFSMLIFRMGEALSRDSITKVKGRITKTPKE